MKKSLEQMIDPVIYSNINEKAWQQALLMVMSEVPPCESYGSSQSYETACNEFMDANGSDGDWPEGFIVWQPFENWALCGVQGVIEEFHDSLISFAQTILIQTQVIDDE